MPNTKTAKKALKQSTKRRLVNRSQRSTLKTLVKDVRTLTQEGKLDEATTALRLVSKRLDQAGAKRLFHPNKSARLKSRLAKLVNSAATKAPEAE
ncbi:MAG: 30S ribosomal protein S20 [Planctomycetaceae bacterium]